METETTYGHTPTHWEASIDGWQAYCADKGLSANPYKRFSDDWTVWKAAYLRAKEADKMGIMCDKEVPAREYRKRHQFEAYDFDSEPKDEGWYSSVGDEL